MADTTERLNRALAGRYTIQRELGRGVFLAEDLKHPRQVAIKVLEPELTVLLGPDRFLREIELAARLQHPHILTLLDSGEVDGLLYYVMPFMAGESLRERLGRERQLPLEDALRLSREVADALDYAHGQGVVHRDIKPENILLQAGHAVVADFGIAHALDAAGGTKLTTAGTVLGTPAYMSPEQVMGSRELDGRSDVYSLGCVLYEMLAGVPPFAGATWESLAHQHLSVEPPPVTSARPTVPGATARALAKALAKVPADRFGTASEFAEALLTSPAPRPPRLVEVAAVVGAIVLAVAVWPLVSELINGRPPDPGKKAWMLVAEFDGPAADSTVVSAIRDLTISALEQSEIVETVPPDQIDLALKSAEKPASTRVDAQVARELASRSAVRTVLEGRIGRLGKGYSLVLRVVDADSARVVLSVSDEAPDDEGLIPTVGRITKRLRARLGERRAALQATRELRLVITPSFEAYRTTFEVGPLMQAGNFRGIVAVYRRALALDPDFAEAWGFMGIAFFNLGEPDSALAALRQALARPERLDEFWRLAYSAQATSLSGDQPGALAACQRLVQLYPQRSSAYVNLGAELASAGRLDEALESARMAEKVSPFGPNQIVLNNQFYALLSLGRVSEARAIVPRLMGRNARRAPMDLAAVAGQWSTAESLATVLSRSPTSDDGLRAAAAWTLAAAQASRGQVRAAQQTLRQAQSEAEGAHGTPLANRTRWTRLALLLFARGVSGDPGEPESPRGMSVQPGPLPVRSDSTTAALVNRGLWAAAAGDTGLARRLLASIRKRSGPDLARQGFTPAVLQAWIAARAGRWEEVVRDLGPAALQGQARGSVLIQPAPVARWLVAEAYERLDRPDSAAAYFERAIAPPPLGGATLSNSRMAFAFGHQRLVLLYARMGRPEEARRHWETFSGTFTRPDPDLAPLLAEARAALANAEGMARSGRR